MERTTVLEQDVFVSEVWDDDSKEWIYSGRNATEQSAERYAKQLIKTGYSMVRVTAPADYHWYRVIHRADGSTV